MITTPLDGTVLEVFPDEYNDERIRKIIIAGHLSTQQVERAINHIVDLSDCVDPVDIKHRWSAWDPETGWWPVDTGIINTHAVGRYPVTVWEP